MPKKDFGGFEYRKPDPRHDAEETAEEDALYVFDHLQPDYPDGMSREAFLWGMEGRGSTPEAAERALSLLGEASRIIFSESGHIQFFPEEPTD